MRARDQLWARYMPHDYSNRRHFEQLLNAVETELLDRVEAALTAAGHEQQAAVRIVQDLRDTEAGDR